MIRQPHSFEISASVFQKPPGPDLTSGSVFADGGAAIRKSSDAPGQSDDTAFFRYLTVSEEAERWGFHVTDVGYSKIGADMPYPPFKHPESYTLNQETGRILAEHQLMYITRGRGTFWSEASGELEVVAGCAFFLFPGVRHRYRPHRENGWDEQWVGFAGDHAARLMSEFFDPANPQIQIGIQPELHSLMLEMCGLARMEVFGFRRIIAAQAMECLARVQVLSGKRSYRTPDQEDLIRRACVTINGAVDRVFDFEKFAAENGMCYTSFRKLFKEITGLAPGQYLLEMRLRKAQVLLTNTNLPIHTVAEESGFENSFYFSRFFKKRTGLPPLRYRKQR